MERHRVLFQKGSAVYFWKKEGVTNNSHISWQGERRAGKGALFGMSNSPAALGPLSCSSEPGDQGRTPQHLLAPFHGRFGCGIAEEAGLRKTRKVEPDP